MSEQEKKEEQKEKQEGKEEEQSEKQEGKEEEVDEDSSSLTLRSQNKIKNPYVQAQSPNPRGIPAAPFIVKIKLLS